MNPWITKSHDEEPDFENGEQDSDHRRPQTCDDQQAENDSDEVHRRWTECQLAQNTFNPPKDEHAARHQPHDQKPDTGQTSGESRIQPAHMTPVRRYKSAAIARSPGRASG